MRQFFPGYLHGFVLAVSTILFAAQPVLLQAGMERHDSVKNTEGKMSENSAAEHWNVIMSFRMYPDMLESGLDALVRIKNETGIYRFVWPFPAFRDFEAQAQCLREIRRRMEPDGIQMDWWFAPTIRAGKKLVVGNAAESGAGAQNIILCFVTRICG